MIRVVADTNIFISAIMFGGLPGIFFDLALLRSFILVTSPLLLDELDEKLRMKFAMPQDDALTVRRKLESVAEVITPQMMLNAVPDDPDDNHVLECAVEGEADYIVSGDRHLLKLESYEKTPILTVRQFLHVITPNKEPLLPE